MRHGNMIIPFHAFLHSRRSAIGSQGLGDTIESVIISILGDLVTRQLSMAMKHIKRLQTLGDKHEAVVSPGILVSTTYTIKGGGRSPHVHGIPSVQADLDERDCCGLCGRVHLAS